MKRPLVRCKEWVMKNTLGPSRRPSRFLSKRSETVEASLPRMSMDVNFRPNLVFLCFTGIKIFLFLMLD